MEMIKDACENWGFFEVLINQILSCICMRLCKKGLINQLCWFFLCVWFEVGEPWYIHWVDGHRGEVNKRALQEDYGAKVQRNGGQQRSWVSSVRNQWLGLGKYLFSAPSSSLQCFREHRSWSRLQVTLNYICSIFLSKFTNLSLIINLFGKSTFLRLFQSKF